MVGLCWLVELNFVLSGGTVSPMAPTLLLGHGQCIIVTIVSIVVSICNQRDHHQEQRGLPAVGVGTHKTPRQSHDRRAPIRIRSFSIKVEMKGIFFFILWVKDISRPGLFGCTHSGQRFL